MILNRKKEDKSEQLIHDIWNFRDSDVVVVRKNGCRVLFMNNAAKKRMEENSIKDEISCREGYSLLFPHLCDNCHSLKDNEEYPIKFDIDSKEGRIFSTSLNAMNWLDNKMANVFYLRDVDDERTANKRLYNLAYMDVLTAIPNRRKFKEDFEELEKDISSGFKCGIVAIFDLDNFKNVNDTYGHNTGDLMLKRFTEHLNGDPLFKGHLYRLGGDEFAFLYADVMESYADPKQYYAELLNNALRSYSMPNIDISCTISMGVSFFPQHGELASELLRKADIALYKAKTAGRNQIAFFEDRYDLAKKFKDVYINIRPVLFENSKTFGYELIDEGSSEKGEDNIEKETVSLNEFNRTIDMLGIEDMSNDVRYLINYTNQMLDMMPQSHLKKKFLIHIQMPSTHKESNFKNYQKLRSLGYELVFSGINKSNCNDKIMSLADYVKFEINPVFASFHKETIEKYPGKSFIASNVDTNIQFEVAKRLGFKLFQGYYFNQVKPMTTKTKDIEPLRVNYFRLLKLTITDDYVDFNEISEVIASDLALSYKLLRLLNSAAIGLKNRISSIPMAVAYLGEENLKKWISLLGLRGVAPNKPLELVRLSLIRARFGELLAPNFPIRRNNKHVFLVGLLSLLHVALDKPQEEVLSEMPLAEDIKESLLTKEGIHSDLVAFFKNFEYANWEEVNHFAQENNLTSQFINDAYMKAVKWCNELIES